VLPTGCYRIYFVVNFVGGNACGKVMELWQRQLSRKWEMLCCFEHNYIQTLSS
jgi:hypothetical protein